MGADVEPDYVDVSRAIPQEHFAPMLKLELVCDDRHVERYMNIIREEAQTGERGDGVVFVSAGQQEQPVVRAFEHYERIRAALAQDATKDIAADAKALSPLARGIAGDDAGRAATSLAQAKDVDKAREQFGELSEALVPKFMDAGLPGVQGFVSLKQKRWFSVAARRRTHTSARRWLAAARDKRAGTVTAPHIPLDSVPRYGAYARTMNHGSEAMHVD